MRSLVMALALTTQIPQTAQNIKDAMPKMRISRAVALSKIIDKVAQKYSIDPDVIVAILAQESSFRSGIISCYPRKKPNGCVVMVCDIGIAQINELWIERLNLNPCRLRLDDAYNIDVAGKILSIVRKGNEDEANWWSRYHDGRPSRRATYELAVGRWMPDRDSDQNVN